MINTVQPSQHPTESSAPLSSSSSPSLPLEQKNKGRCFSCRSKVIKYSNNQYIISLFSQIDSNLQTINKQVSMRTCILRYSSFPR